MKYTKIAHFWEWFERHHQTFLDFESLTRTERQYWLAELNGHLTTYNRFLVPQLQRAGSGPGKQCQLIISALGRSCSFIMVDRLLKQAPQLRSWELVALQPAAGFDDYAFDLLQHLKASIGRLWFDVRNIDADGKIHLYVLAEFGERLKGEHPDKVKRLLYHMLGERMYGWSIADISLQWYQWLPEEDRPCLELLEKIPARIQKRLTAGMAVGKDGRLKR